MDNTELHYLTYDPDAIWAEMMKKYVDAGGDILYPGDEKEMLLRSVLADFVQIFAGVDNALRMQTLRYAVGTYLDVIGELRGCERITASAATATVTIVTNVTGRSTVLPAGTAMTADGEIFYTLQEDLSLSGYQETLTAAVEADRTGSVGNGLLTGTEMGLAITNEAVYSIVVATDATGGNEKEDDDTYRERIREHGLASVTTGPAAQYEAAAKDVSSIIVDARAINIGAGQVGVYLLLSDETGSAAIIQSVIDTLSAKNARPLTDTVTVGLATDIAYTLNVKYEYKASETSPDTITQAVTEYQEWQDQTIGRAFNPDKLIASMYQAGATRVYLQAGSAFNSGTVEYTTIQENERCKGTITLTAAPV